MKKFVFYGRICTFLKYYRLVGVLIEIFCAGDPDEDIVIYIIFEEIMGTLML
jgi:hypothetical protein